MSAEPELHGIDDDAGADDEPDTHDQHDGNEPAAAHVCPECGASFSRASALGLHRFRTHGIKGARRDRTNSRKDGAPRRPPAPGRGGNLEGRKRLVRETIVELLDTRRAIAEGLDTDELGVADTIRRDADLIAGALAGLAERVDFLGVAIDRLLGVGGPLSFVRAFGPTLRKMIVSRRAAAVDRDQQQAAVDAEYGRILSEQGQEAADLFAERVRRGEVWIA